MERTGKLYRPDQPGRTEGERLSRVEKALDVLLGRSLLTVDDSGEVASAAAPASDRPVGVA